MHIALRDHQLLSDRDFLRRDLHAKITTRYHDAIGRLQDVIKVLQPFLILDFGYDLNVLPTSLVQSLQKTLARISTAERALEYAMWRLLCIAIPDSPSRIIPTLICKHARASTVLVGTICPPLASACFCSRLLSVPVISPSLCNVDGLYYSCITYAQMMHGWLDTEHKLWNWESTAQTVPPLP